MKDKKLNNHFDNFDNLELTVRKTSVIQERMNLVSTHMYRQFLEYQKAILNTNEMFIKMVENLHATCEYLKQTFASRGIPTQNIYYEVDPTKTIAKFQILWYSISFTIRHNDKPQALFREGKDPLFSGRIIAINGDISKLLNSTTSYSSVNYNTQENELQKILEQEVASVFIPADKSSSAIIKIRHIGNREFPIKQIDAPKEFLLKVVEIICGGGIYHEENFRRNITI